VNRGKPDNSTVCIGEWCFQVAGDTAYVHHRSNPGDIHVTDQGERLRVQVFNDEVDVIKGEIRIEYKELK
jgi:hypothetical protein